MTREQHMGSPGGGVTAEDEKRLSLIEHLRELRDRLVRAGLAVLVGMGVGLFLVLGPLRLVDVIIAAFAPTDRPYPPLQAVGTVEAFSSYMKVALAVGVVLAMPVIVYQIIAFVSPGLTKKERRYVFLALPFVMGFFLSGVAFGWFVTVPVAIRFLIGFSDSALIAVQPSLADFLQTVTVMVLINGVVFELPVVIYVLAALGLITAAQLVAYRRYALLVVVVVAAFITPTGDPVNLLLLAVPMYLLYELGVVLARFAPKRK
jgi:sec-independent protein translocase protein TatC